MGVTGVKGVGVGGGFSASDDGVAAAGPVVEVFLGRYGYMSVSLYLHRYFMLSYLAGFLLLFAFCGRSRFVGLVGRGRCCWLVRRIWATGDRSACRNCLRRRHIVPLLGRTHLGWLLGLRRLLHHRRLAWRSLLPSTIGHPNRLLYSRHCIHMLRIKWLTVEMRM